MKFQLPDCKLPAPQTEAPSPGQPTHMGTEGALEITSPELLHPDRTGIHSTNKVKIKGNRYISTVSPEGDLFTRCSVYDFEQMKRLASSEEFDF